MQNCAVLWFTAKTFFKRRPLAATYLCRTAAKARFNNRKNPRVGVSKGEGSQPLPFGRFKGKGSLRKGGNRNPPFLKPFFGHFLSGKKVTRRRQKKNETPTGGAEPRPYKSLKRVLRRRHKRERIATGAVRPRNDKMGAKFDKSCPRCYTAHKDAA